jgi:hypothetical protein
VKVYIDTGLFIDCLTSRGPVGAYLRTAAGRGRSPAALCIDAECCLSKIAQSHKGITSSLTYYEVEEALFRELVRKNTGVAHAKKYLIPAARSAITQVMMTKEPRTTNARGTRGRFAPHYDSRTTRGWYDHIDR